MGSFTATYAQSPTEEYLHCISVEASLSAYFTNYLLEDRPDMEFISQTIQSCQDPGIKSFFIFHSLQCVSLLKKDFLTETDWKLIYDHYYRMQERFQDVYAVERQDMVFGKQFKKIVIYIERNLKIFPYSFDIQEATSARPRTRGGPVVTQTNRSISNSINYSSVISGQLRDHQFSISQTKSAPSYLGSGR